MKRILVLGASGLIGSNLVRYLKTHEECFVRALDIVPHQYGKLLADEVHGIDLRFVRQNDPLFYGFDEVYQLAARMGGMGYMVPDNDAIIMRDSGLINLSVLEACRHQGVGRVFFSSSACVYPDGPCNEDAAYPAMPEINYGWEKLYAERLYEAYARCHGLKTKIGRLHNVYGPFGCYDGGREKAPAAICRKVAEQPNYGGILEIWGDGEQMRSFMWIDDCIEGILRLTRSDTFSGPVNIGSAQCVSINYLAQVTMMVAGKQCELKHIDGPRGVAGRNSDNTLILKELGWAPRTPLHIGMEKLYAWVKEQIDAKQKAA